MGITSLIERERSSFGNRLKTCDGCPHTSYEIECGATWHSCEKGRYKNIITLPIDGECPGFPKPEDNVPGEVLENARKLTEKKTIPEVVKALGIDV